MILLNGVIRGEIVNVSLELTQLLNINDIN